MMSIHEVSAYPQFISTNRHIMQGYVDLVRTEWLPGRNILRGISKIVGGDPYVVTIAANGYILQNTEVNDPSVHVAVDNTGSGLVKLTIMRDENVVVEWDVKFEKPAMN